MSLRRQLLLVSLLLLALPWAGCQFVREIESGLRASQARALMATAEAMATALRDRADLLYPDTDRLKELPADDGGLYAWPSVEPIIVDGYAEGWDAARTQQLRNDSGLTLGVQGATRDGRLYLECDSAGASIGYRIERGRWQVYSQPIAIRSGTRVEARAVRYGWEESESVEGIAP